MVRGVPVVTRSAAAHRVVHRQAQPAGDVVAGAGRDDRQGGLGLGGELDAEVDHAVAAHHGEHVQALRDGAERAVAGGGIRLVGEVEDLVPGGPHPLGDLDAQRHAAVLARGGVHDQADALLTVEEFGSRPEATGRMPRRRAPSPSRACPWRRRRSMSVADPERREVEHAQRDGQQEHREGSGVGVAMAAKTKITKNAGRQACDRITEAGKTRTTLSATRKTGIRKAQPEDEDEPRDEAEVERCLWIVDGTRRGEAVEHLQRLGQRLVGEPAPRRGTAGPSPR